ncbi:DUF2478 domain-containing protein [Azospirillum sp. B506]|uniref:DUF2478 domain-containing protein n=1 Tax=Azospirillum sp. B506 TaxID=137721 RepID=UPI000344B735|nr:DUF2478 domain-containing protein [Azospirillum sp. B506]
MHRPLQGHPSLAGIPPVRPPFDDRSDVAAVVYGSTDNPDRLLSGFLFNLQTQGFDAVGIVQVRRKAPLGGGAPHGFRLLSGQGTLSSDAEPDGESLAGIGRRLAVLVDGRPDIVVLNRFGWQELNGAGLLDVLHLAMLREVPAVIAVPEALFPHWLDLANGLTVRLPCDRAALDRWWVSLWRAPPGGRHPTACERDK